MEKQKQGPEQTIPMEAVYVIIGELYWQLKQSNRMNAELIRREAEKKKDGEEKRAN